MTDFGEAPSEVTSFCKPLLPNDLSFLNLITLVPFELRGLQL
jgi:hypothetical protein